MWPGKTPISSANSFILSEVWPYDTRDTEDLLINLFL